MAKAKPGVGHNHEQGTKSAAIRALLTENPKMPVRGVVAELAGRVRAFRISEELPDRLDISRNPSQAMGGALLVMRRAVGRRRLGCEPLAH